MTEWRKLKHQSFGIGYINVVQKTFELPDGETADFWIKDEAPSVCVFALTKKKQVILAKQFRPGPEKVLLELPGGHIEKGETPIQAIKRELLEETGYTGKFRLVAQSLDCAHSTRVRYNFVATDCVKLDEPANHEHEFTEVALMPLPKFRQHLRSGQLTDIETGYLGLDYLQLL